MAKENRDGKRVRRESFAKRQPKLGYYYIVTDTDATEQNYLMGIKQSLPKTLKDSIVIKVVRRRTVDLVRTCIENAAMLPQYAQCWIVFDRDLVNGFDNIIMEASKFGINVGWSNPCIEVWFDAYFGKMHGYADSVTCCRNFAETFKQKTGYEYDKADPRLYSLLYKFGKENDAIVLAERRLKQHYRDGIENPSMMCPCTTLHRLVKIIRDAENSFVG